LNRNTAIQEAVVGDCAQVVEALASAGADLSKINFENVKAAVVSAAKNGHHEYSYNRRLPLLLASQKVAGAHSSARKSFFRHRLCGIQSEFFSKISDYLLFEVYKYFTFFFSFRS